MCKIYETNIDPNIKPCVNEEVDEVFREIEQKAYDNLLKEMKEKGCIECLNSLDMNLEKYYQCLDVYKKYVTFDK